MTAIDYSNMDDIANALEELEKLREYVTKHEKEIRVLNSKHSEHVTSILLRHHSELKDCVEKIDELRKENVENNRYTKKLRKALIRYNSFYSDRRIQPRRPKVNTKLSKWPVRRIPVEVRYCKLCSDPILREDMTPSKYKKKVYCGNACASSAREAKKIAKRAARG